MTQKIDVTPLSGACGAVITGVDLSESLANETFAAIHQALLDHQVIFFRDQNLTPDQQVAFSGDKGFEFVPRKVEKELILGGGGFSATT